MTPLGPIGSPSATVVDVCGRRMEGRHELGSLGPSDAFASETPGTCETSGTPETSPVPTFVLLCPALVMVSVVKAPLQCDDAAGG